MGTLMTCTGQTIPGGEVTAAGTGDFVSFKKKFQLVEYVPSLRTAGVTSHAPLIWVLSSVDQVQTSPAPSYSLTLCPAVRDVEPQLLGAFGPAPQKHLGFIA